jgi:DNA-binding response OmpR family regulator
MAGITRYKHEQHPNLSLGRPRAMLGDISGLPMSTPVDYGKEVAEVAEEKIMVVEPDSLLRGVICGYLADAGFRTYPVTHGNVMELIDRERPAVVVLDTALKRIDALYFCRAVRAHYDMPLMLITDREDDPVVLKGLALGADDYLVKPIRKAPLVAKMSAHVRRYTMSRRQSDTVLRFRDLEIDMASDTVRRSGHIVALTRTEYRLLVGLARSAGRVCSSSELFEWLWRQPDGGDARSIQVHVSNLRKKLEPNPGHPSYVVTVRGQGYKFNASEHRAMHLA